MRWTLGAVRHDNGEPLTPISRYESATERDWVNEDVIQRLIDCAKFLLFFALAAAAALLASSSPSTSRSLWSLPSPAPRRMRGYGPLVLGSLLPPPGSPAHAMPPVCMRASETHMIRWALFQRDRVQRLAITKEVGDWAGEGGVYGKLGHA
jgi:hypothetical protein